MTIVQTLKVIMLKMMYKWEQYVWYNSRRKKHSAK